MKQPKVLSFLFLLLISSLLTGLLTPFSGLTFAGSSLHHEQEYPLSQLSKTLKTPFLTNFLGIYWPHLDTFKYDKNFLIRSSQDGKHWSPWQEVFLMTEGPDEQTEQKFDYGQLLFTKNAHYIQVKVTHLDLSQVKLGAFTLVFIDSRQPSIALAKQNKIKRSIAGEEFYMISREGWGADESICWTKETPTPQETVTHLFIHHSALNSNIAHEDCDDAIRGYLDYHVHDKNHLWSDIGYNYLVCPHGVLYQGRRFAVEKTMVDGKEVVTPKDVIGAQVVKYNKGTLGICAIGSYMGEVQPSKELQNILYRTLLWKVTQYGIDPLGHTPYTPKDVKEPQSLETVSGHRDAPLTSTECPGDNLHAVIPALRNAVAERLKQPK